MREKRERLSENLGNFLENGAMFKIQWDWDFPGGPVVKNPRSNAGDMGWIPGQGTKIPHATRQLSLTATTTEPAH